MKTTKEPLISHFFSKVIVVFCVLYMVRIIEKSMDITMLLGIDTSNIILVSAGFFGGELLFMAAKTAFKYKHKSKLEQVKLQVEANKEQDCD